MAAFPENKTVFYKGQEDDWQNITIDDGNYNLTNATRYYYSDSEPDEQGNYWHYGDNGEPVVW